MKTFFSEGRRQFSVFRATDAVEVLSGGSIRLSAARCIRLTGKSFGRTTSYASDTREVEVIIKGKATKIILAPKIEYKENVESFSPFASFWLKPVLMDSHLLLTSSDLSRVKVSRRDPKTGQKLEWVIDCSGSKAPDLWLRAGDVIEVPEKM